MIFRAWFSRFRPFGDFLTKKIREKPYRMQCFPREKQKTITSFLGHRQPCRSPTLVVFSRVAQKKPKKGERCNTAPQPPLLLAKSYVLTGLCLSVALLSRRTVNFRGKRGGGFTKTIVQYCRRELYFVYLEGILYCTVQYCTRSLYRK